MSEALVKTNQENKEIIKKQHQKLKKLVLDKREKEKELKKLKRKLDEKDEQEEGKGKPGALKGPGTASSTTVVEHEVIPIQVGPDGMEIPGSSGSRGSRGSNSLFAGVPPISQLPPVISGSDSDSLSSGAGPSLSSLGSSAYSGSVPGGSVSMGMPRQSHVSSGSTASQLSSGSLSDIGSIIASLSGVSSGSSVGSSVGGSMGPGGQTLATVKLLGDLSGSAPAITAVTDVQDSLMVRK